MDAAHISQRNDRAYTEQAVQTEGQPTAEDMRKEGWMATREREHELELGALEKGALEAVAVAKEALRSRSQRRRSSKR